MPEQTVDTGPVTVTADGHQHHWVLPASGDRMDGVCKLCGAGRRFQARTDEHVWEEERSADAAYWSSTDTQFLTSLAERAVA